MSRRTSPFGKRFSIVLMPRAETALPSSPWRLRRRGWRSSAGIRCLGVEAQEPVADGVERPAPDAARVDGDELLDARQHLARRFVGEGEEQDVGRSTPSSISRETR